MSCFLSLDELLAIGRSPEHPVAWIGRGPFSRRINWDEFSAYVAALSDTLAHRDEQHWLLACKDPFDFTVALFAVWHAGRRALLPPSLRPHAIAEISQHADGILGDLRPWWKDGLSTTPRLLMPLDPQIAMLDLFTSGSSGTPKRVTKRLAQLDAEVSVLESLWGNSICNPVLATTPHYHIYGLLFLVLWPLAAGRPFDNETCSAPELLLGRIADLKAYGPCWVISSPSQLARMPRLISLNSLVGQVSRIFSSGSPLDAVTASCFHTALGQAPLEVLGSTETGGIGWRIQHAHTQDTAWTPLPNVAVSVNQDGVLTVASSFLPDHTAMTTSDAAELLSDGRFHVQGRLDRIVKIEGKRLSLVEMEARLAQNMWVREAALVVLMKGQRHTVGALLVLTEEGQRQLLRNGRAVIARALRRYLSYHFDAVLLPRYWRYLAALPYNACGKRVVSDLVALFDPVEQSSVEQHSV